MATRSLCLLALSSASALQLDSLEVRRDMSRRAAIGAGGLAAFGLVAPVLAAEELISPAKAKILAAKAAQAAKLAENGGTPSAAPKARAVADSSAQGRSGKAQTAQAMQKKIAKQQKREKEQERLAREAAAEAAKNAPPLTLPSLPSLPSLPF